MGPVAVRPFSVCRRARTRCASSTMWVYGVYPGGVRRGVYVQGCTRPVSAALPACPGPACLCLPGLVQGLRLFRFLTGPVSRG